MADAFDKKGVENDCSIERFSHIAQHSALSSGYMISHGNKLGPMSWYLPRCMTYDDESDPPEATGLLMDAFARGAIGMSFMFLGPALLELAQTAARCEENTNDDNLTAEEDDCEEGRVYGMKPSSLLTNIAVVSSVLGAILMPPIGAMVDHTPYRKTVGAISAGILTAINGVQAFLSERTWGFVALLQVLGAFQFLTHNTAQYAYISELSNDVSKLSEYNADFNVVIYVSMLLFLIVVMICSLILQTEDDVGTAIISQIVAFFVGAVFFGYSWRYLFRPRPALSEVPPGTSLLTCGFRKMTSTARRIRAEFPALKLFLISVLMSESATGAFSSIATTYMSHFMQMSAQEIGVTFFLVLVSGIPGSKIGAKISHRFNPIVSAQICLVLWIVTTAIASLVLTGPDKKRYVLLFGAMWGSCLGWLHPTHTTILCTIIPRGQESELMGVYLFCGQILAWLPPLLFTILNENGVNMSIGLASMCFFFMVALVLLFLIGSHDRAMEQANGNGMHVEISRLSDFCDISVPRENNSAAMATLQADTIGFRGLSENGTVL